ncbi:MAG: hypothetical protein ABMB14_13160 [Myxococcota bacterium]
MDVSRTITEFWKIWLACGGVGLALAWPWIARWRTQVLVALVVLSAVNYSRWGTDAIVRRVDAYDLLHYYVNAKYFDELGYLDLYPAILLVDQENGGPFYDQGPVYMAQDETGHHLVPIAQGIARGREVRARFSDAEWAAFEHDVLYLQRTVGCREKSRKTGKCVREIDDELWRQLINDHGFNGTTAWTLIARPFAEWVPVEYVKWLGFLDVGLLVGALGLVTWAYGGTTALWTVLFLAITYSTRWPYLSWVFLRYDWIALLLAATALLRKGHPALAGVVTGWSATLRLFPAMWMWGPFCKGLAGLRHRVVHRSLLWLAAGFVGAVLVIQGAATLRFGVSEVESHFENMMDHNKAEQLSSRRIGLALALATEPWQGTRMETVITQQRKERIDAQQPLRYAIALAVMAALGLAVRNQRDDEAFGYGFLPFYLLTTASYYYYVARTTLIPIHASGLDQARHRVGLALLFGIEAFSNAAEYYVPGHRLFLIGELAWSLALYTAVVVGWPLIADLVARRRATATVTG